MPICINLFIAYQKNFQVRLTPPEVFQSSISIISCLNQWSGRLRQRNKQSFSILSRFIWIRCQIVLYLVLASILFSSFITGFYFISNVKDIEDKANFQKSVNRLISPLDHTWKRRRSCNRKVIFCGLSKLLTHFHWVCVVILRNLSLAICRWPGR